MRSLATETVRESVALSSVVSSGTDCLMVKGCAQVSRIKIPNDCLHLLTCQSTPKGSCGLGLQASVDPWPVGNERFSSDGVTLNFRRNTQQLEVTIFEVILGPATLTGTYIAKPVLTRIQAVTTTNTSPRRV